MSGDGTTLGLAIVLMDLDRCEHGRHHADPCLMCPDGESTGNLLLPPGTVIGTSVYGEEIVVPEGRRLSDPQAWRPRRGARKA